METFFFYITFCAIATAHYPHSARAKHFQPAQYPQGQAAAQYPQRQAAPPSQYRVAQAFDKRSGQSPGQEAFFQRSGQSPGKEGLFQGSPLEQLIKTAKSWLSADAAPGESLPPKMRDHRLPKPPKYPLYDMDSISMATPPPAPIMHPMSSLPSDFRGQQRVQNRQDRPRRPIQRTAGRPPQRGERPRERPQSRPRERPQSRPTSYYPHPSASNLESVNSAPALGRPLSFEEYMSKPAHSYVNDPWNFDPFANQMNQGLHTDSLKYNYDPLGMNQLDPSSPSMSHLDPSKLSYPGDTHSLSDTSPSQAYTQAYPTEAPQKIEFTIETVSNPYGPPTVQISPKSPYELPQGHSQGILQK